MPSKYCMEPKYNKNNNKKLHHQKHASMSLRLQWVPWNFCFPHLYQKKLQLPPFYFLNINIRVHSSSCIPANSHSSTSWLALVQPSGIRSQAVSNISHFLVTITSLNANVEKEPALKVDATLWLCFPVRQHQCLGNFSHLQAASSLDL